MCIHFMKILNVYTLHLHLLTLKARITKSYMLLSSAEIIFEVSLTNSVDQDQTGYGSTLFASIHMLTNKQTFSDVNILLALLGLNHRFFVFTVYTGVLWRKMMYCIFEKKTRLIFSF